VTFQKNKCGGTHHREMTLLPKESKNVVIEHSTSQFSIEPTIRNTSLIEFSYIVYYVSSVSILSFVSKVMATQIFRFFDLPAELRLAVYEHITPYIGYSVWKVPITLPTPDPSTTALSSIVKITKSLSLAILRVYKSTYAEAHPILSGQLRKMKPEPVRLNVHCVNTTGFVTTEIAVWQALFLKRSLALLMDQIIHEGIASRRRRFYDRSVLPHTYDVEIALNLSDPQANGSEFQDALDSLFKSAGRRDIRCVVYCNGLLPQRVGPISKAELSNTLTWFEYARSQIDDQWGWAESARHRMKLEELNKEEWAGLQAKWADL
jgi:hypothetical protein